MKASEASVVKPAIQEIMKNLKEPVTFKNYQVFTAELTKLTPGLEF